MSGSTLRRFSRTSAAFFSFLGLAAAVGCQTTGVSTIDEISNLGFTAPAPTDVTAVAATSTAADDALAARFPQCAAPAAADTWRQEILDLVNTARAANGLGPVAFNAVLEAQADEYACELIRYDYFAHVNPVTGSTLSQRTADFGYSYAVVGENLAAGQSTPQQAFNDWMNSPTHRANILEPRFTELGIGIRTGGTYGTYWVQEFGLPAPSRRAP